MYQILRGGENFGIDNRGLYDSPSCGLGGGEKFQVQVLGEVQSDRCQ